MNRQDADAIIADVMADHFARLRDDMTAHIERAIAARAVPPFSPPVPWTAGRHGAGAVVRHRNGIFSAIRDTTEEPGTSAAWLPLVVGISGICVSFHERTLALAIELSDGTQSVFGTDFALPIVRGYWEPDAAYAPGDRVFRFGEWSAVAPSTGIDPQGDADGTHWAKVAGKAGRRLSFKLDDDGTLFEDGRAIGTLKPLVADLLQRLVTARE